MHEVVLCTVYISNVRKRLMQYTCVYTNCGTVVPHAGFLSSSDPQAFAKARTSVPNGIMGPTECPFHGGEASRTDYMQILCWTYISIHSLRIFPKLRAGVVHPMYCR